MTESNTHRLLAGTRRISMLVSLLASCHTLAGEVIRTEPLEGMTFDSEASAVAAMSAHCLSESKRDNAEHLGAVLLTGHGEYRVTHGQAGPGAEVVTFAIPRSADTSIVALWHTHGAKGRNTERFSIQDGDTVRETGVPFYLIAPSGRISLLVDADAGLSHAVRTSNHAHRYVRVRSFPGLTLFKLERDESHRAPARSSLMPDRRGKGNHHAHRQRGAPGNDRTGPRLNARPASETMIAEPPRDDEPMPGGGDMGGMM